MNADNPQTAMEQVSLPPPVDATQVFTTTPPGSVPSTGAGTINLGEASHEDISRDGKAHSSRYRIVKSHAKGGLGEVFVATDLELNREIALKEIRDIYRSHPMLTADFLREAQITGKLEHPGIVPIYGLGLYADGRPYYAMRFIQGEEMLAAINRFHAEKIGFETVQFRLLLNRFIDACNAIGYAHSKGIIHRDIKPANIMLGSFGETLVVDWGLGKEIGQTEAPSIPGFDGESPEQTTVGTIKGTPAYMAPEQAEGKIDELNAACDIFSLGGTLFTLLTGRVPMKGTTTEIRDKLRNHEIPIPREFNPNVPLALDAICRKAMNDKPADRYRSASELAGELEQYLADEPVAAHPETFVVRARRWMRKHPGTVAGTTASLCVGIAALVLGLVVIGGKNSELAQANAEERAAKRLANTRREEAETARDQARQRFLLALEAFDQMVFGIQNKLENRPGTQELRRDLLENAREGLAELLKEAEKQGSPDHSLISSHFQMGKVEENLGNSLAAQKEYRTGYELARKLAEADPQNAEAQRDLSISFHRLGDVTLQLGQTPEALELFQKGLQLNLRLAEAAPKDAQAQRDLSVSYERLGDVSMLLNQLPEAKAFYQKGKQVTQSLAEADPKNAPAQRGLSVSFNKLGDVSLKLGQTEDAMQFYRNSSQILQQLAAADPKNAEAQRDLSVSYERLGDVMMKLDQPKAALEFYEKGLQIAQRLADADPKNAQAQRGLSVSFNLLGNVSLELGQIKDALTFYRMGLQITQHLAEVNPDNAQAQRDLSVSYWKIALVHLREDRFAEAGRMFAKAEPLAVGFSKPGFYPEELPWIRSQMAICRNAVSAIEDIEFAFTRAPSEIPELLAIRLRANLKAGNAGESARTAERFADWAETQPDRDDQRYNAACAFSLASALDEKLIDRSVALLTLCREAGSFTRQRIAHLERDGDFDGIRKHPTFVAFLQSLEPELLPSPTERK